MPPGIGQLLDVLNLPAFVENRRFDVLAANRLATGLWHGLRPGTNRLRATFLDPDERDLLPDWEQVIGGMVAAFRASIGTDPEQLDDPRTTQLVGELSLASEPFRRLWARHDVVALAGGPVRIRHPRLGLLHLRREKLPIGDSGGQLLVLHHAEPGSPSAAALELLASSTATTGDGSPQDSPQDSPASSR